MKGLTSPVRPEAGKAYLEDAIAGPQFRAFDGLSEDRQLLSQGEVLDGYGNVAHNEGPEE